ncbi:MAG TPA: ABC transporter permease [Intrasporangium sp.]|uniref:ABC transporter permease n=1 Tax=Intrasporangium sp. TaxID=1925024 RepID=UPI002D7973F0|nr:ABC transporter permease [Intrasporangium sp.]HET7398465.1 ABC transporter permease [Intrasporangium sp.]
MTADTPARAPVAAARPAAAPRRTRVLSQAGFEVSGLLRNGEQLLVSLVLPAMVLVALHLGRTPSLGPGRRIDVAVPGVLALCTISSAFTSQAIATGFDRRYSVLKYLGVTPLGRAGLLAAKAVATVAIQLLQVVVLGGLGLVLGWRPQARGIPYAVLFLVVGAWAFVALALLLAGTLRAEAVLALANLVWVLLLVAGGVVVPRSELPVTAGSAAGALPSAGLADGLRSALVAGRLDVGALVVVVAWGVACSAAAARWFRWSD